MRSLRWHHLVVGLCLSSFTLDGGGWNAGVLRAEETSDSVAAAGTLKDLDGHFPFTPPAEKQQWEERAEAVRQQLRVALGIWPMPKLAELKPVRHSRKEMTGYSVENVYFESLPGFHVTGNLYLPANMEEGKKYPAVLCPHGHWTEARFYDAGEGERRRLLSNGEERFENAARNHIQARCVHLARMGCIVFHWDMIGYCDSQQINSARAHGYAKQDPSTEVTDAGWVLFSPRAEELGQSVMGLQTINTQASLEFVLSLPQVDASKIGITGASGGGTQTFIAAALDPRFSVAFPAVMVSTAMQGGCTCENASGLRVDTGNIEIAALIAPRPLGMTAANDWTKDMAKDGFPQLQQLYQLYNAKEKVALFPSLHYGHNYNHVSRVSMYGWFNQHWGLGYKMPVLEDDFAVLLRPDLTVYDQAHPKPEGGLEFERKLLKAWHNDQTEQLTSGLKQPTNSEGYKKSVEQIKSGWKGLLGPDIQAFRGSEVKVLGGADAPIVHGVLSHPKLAESVHVAATGKLDSQKVLIVISDLGCDVLANAKGALAEMMAAKKDKQDYIIVAADLTGQHSKFIGGERVVGDSQQPLVGNPRLAAAYTYGYNRPVAVKRAQQVLAMVAALRQSGAQTIEVVGEGEVAISAAVAAFQSAGEINKLVVDVKGADLDGAASIRSIDFFPGSQRFFHIPGLMLTAGVAERELRVDGKVVSPLEAIKL